MEAGQQQAHPLAFGHFWPASSGCLSARATGLHPAACLWRCSLLLALSSCGGGSRRRRRPRLLQRQQREQLAQTQPGPLVQPASFGCDDSGRSCNWFELSNGFAFSFRRNLLPKIRTCSAACSHSKLAAATSCWRSTTCSPPPVPRAPSCFSATNCEPATTCCLSSDKPKRQGRLRLHRLCCCSLAAFGRHSGACCGRCAGALSALVGGATQLLLLLLLLWLQTPVGRASARAFSIAFLLVPVDYLISFACGCSERVHFGRERLLRAAAQCHSM